VDGECGARGEERAPLVAGVAELALDVVADRVGGEGLEAQDRGEKELAVWGDGSPTREFLYVEDAADGIVAAAEKYNGPEPVNLGSGYEISIKDLTEMVIRLTGFEGKLVWDTEKPNGQPRRGLDVSRAKEYFGWQAQVPFEEGMRRTIEWFKENRANIK